MDSKKSVAIVFMMLGGLFLALQGCLVHQMSIMISTEMWLLARFLIGFILIFLYLVFLHRPQTLFRRYVMIHSWKISLLSGVLGFVALGCYFWSLKYLSLSVATVLFLSFPLLLPYALKIGAQRKVSHAELFCMLFMCVGIGCLMQSSPYWIVLIAFASGVIFSIWIVMIKKLHMQDTFLNIALHYFFVATVCAFLLFLMNQEDAPIVWTPLIRYGLISIGVVGVLCQLFFTLSIRYATSRGVIPFIYCSLVITVFLDKWYIKAPLTLGDLFGMVLIILGGIAIIRTSLKGTCGNL